MYKEIFNVIGWMILLGLGVSWIVFGYSNWYLSLLPLAYISFSIKDGSYKELAMLKKMSLLQIFSVLFAFIASVALVFGLIQLANYLINDLLQLSGITKTISVIGAIILALYPVKIIFATIVYKIMSNLNDAK